MITQLPFDSSLFGYPVGKFLADEFWDEAAFIEQAKDFHLVYIFSKKPITITSKHIHPFDIRLTFEKELKNPTAESPEIKPFTEVLKDQLLALALESGIHSRFNTDPNFKNGEFQKLYQVWIQKAVDEKQVLIADEISGFVTYEVSEAAAQIGLIAVDPQHRGKGLAKRLVKAAEKYAFQDGAHALSIGTQQTNLPSCNLYQKLGYTEKEKVFVYHYWRD
jgi:dTDP-4-amino-4,6-dideoxy-D-galactose acyltransferase